MSGTVVDNNASSLSIPTDIAGHMLDLDEDDDLEVFSKVIHKLRKSWCQLQTESCADDGEFKIKRQVFTQTL